METEISKRLIEYAKFLRNSKVLKTHEGVMADKRVDAFKGVHAGRALTSKVAEKKFGAEVDSEEKAQKVLQEMLDAGLFLRVVSINNTRFLQPDTSRAWSNDAFYAWTYEGSQLTTILMGLLFIAAAFSMFLIPLWPYRLRMMLWYVTMCFFAFVAFVIVTAIIRAIIFVITYFTVKPGIWIFPRLLDDNAGVLESFVPLWEWHKPAASSR